MKDGEYSNSIRFVIANAKTLLENYDFNLKEVLVFNQEFDSIESATAELTKLAFNSLALREDGSFKRNVTNWGVMGESKDDERFVIAWCGIGDESERIAKFIATALFNFMPLVKLVSEIHAEIPERTIVSSAKSPAKGRNLSSSDTSS